MKFGQLGVYLQDEWNIRDNFKLTAGIRMDNLSFLNDIMRNQAIYDLDFNGMHIDTGAWPDSKLQFSPRVGFTWDVFNDKTLKVRGGSGFFTGRIPLVFFTNMPTNSGMIQNLVSITTRYKDGVVTSRDPRLELLKGNMITDVNQMISTLGLPTSISPEEACVAKFRSGYRSGLQNAASLENLISFGLPAACIFPADGYTGRNVL